jgi:hypothetical protein
MKAITITRVMLDRHPDTGLRLAEPMLHVRIEVDNGDHVAAFLFSPGDIQAVVSHLTDREPPNPSLHIAKIDMSTLGGGPRAGRHAG